MKTYELNIIIKKHYKKPIYSWKLYDENESVFENCEKLNESMNKDEIVVNILKTVLSWIIDNNKDSKNIKLIIYTKDGSIKKYKKLLTKTEYSEVEYLIDKIGAIETGIVYENFFKYQDTEKYLNNRINSLNQMKEVEYLENITDIDIIKERLWEEKRLMEEYMSEVEDLCLGNDCCEKMTNHYDKFNILLGKLLHD